MYLLTLIFELVSMLSLFLVLDNYNNFSHKNIFDVLVIVGTVRFGFLFIATNHNIFWASLAICFILLFSIFFINQISNKFPDRPYIILVFLCSLFFGKVTEYFFGSYYIGSLQFDKPLVLGFGLLFFGFLFALNNIFTKTNLRLYLSLIKYRDFSNFLGIDSRMARTWLNVFGVTAIGLVAVLSSMYYNNATLQYFEFSSYILVFLGIFLPKNLGLLNRILIVSTVYFLPESFRLLGTNSTILIQLKEIFGSVIFLIVISIFVNSRKTPAKN
jgi:hypothetical protein